MRYEVEVGRDNRVIETDGRGKIIFIDGSDVCDIDEHDIATCAVALARKLINEGYVNSQDLSGLSDREAERAEQYINERRGK